MVTKTNKKSHSASARAIVPCLIGVTLIWLMLPIAAQRLSGPQLARLQEQRICRRHLSVLNLGLTAYMADWDGKLPSLDSPAKFKKQIMHYRIPGGDLECPFTSKMYHLNGWLAGKRLDDFENKKSLIVIWSQTGSGGYIVLDGNGRIRMVDSGTFSSMRHASHI
jgi:hypothetical protein